MIKLLIYRWAAERRMYEITVDWKIKDSQTPYNLLLVSSLKPYRNSINSCQAGYGSRLIDECHLLIHPVILSGGKPALPADLLVQLKLVNERRFKSGVVHLYYRIID